MGKPVPVDSPSDLLRKGRRLTDVYDHLYGLEYLDAEYELRSDGRAITELSPGQKGTILLMFYLLIDQSGRPIALDQPDENLDNHTVHTLLRPAIRAAKANRQVIVVTHSPNLAVVGDADQVIVAESDGKEFRYRSGSIENPVVRDLVVRVLEGTWPAFTDRARKYSASEFDEAQAELAD
jgi:ABC-type enterochelin transport system ATPase subunit